MGAFLPDKTRPIIICADQDGEDTPAHKAVEKAVTALKEEGFSVSVIRPSVEHEKDDFNDVLKRDGVEGVRKYFEEHLDSGVIAVKQDRLMHEPLSSQAPHVLVQDQEKAPEPPPDALS